ncbi:pilus assembly protein [Cognatishimia sp. SS12]|uniref:TadE/TadG family type IV pilus assembly protein n=1 Tax=Cognatishimia sp. SS12 TaxID=2979465 RepID=UPI00232D32A1|nr:TadE/TadG family type IV pilus assembly protein [Cognatishimia sp. SS12]MDC0736855.1 pilus assembly protein [Cognatishimia sp. SS12]
MGHHSARHRRTDSARFLRQFRREEDGSMVYLGMIIFLIMLMVGGIGVDVMLAEMRRTQLQDTLDRAVLAASSLEQDLDPQSVVEDYFEKSALSEHLQDIQVEEGLGYRTVTATADTSMATKFMHLAGVDTLTMNALSGAEERIGSVEISMVLDVSGSMNNNSRLYNLKIAAKDFVDTLTTTTEDGKLSVNIVPYATQVSAPDSLAQYLNLSTEHSHSNCINFASDDFATTTLDPATAFTRTMHFDPWSSNDGRDDDPVNLVSNPVCRESTDTSRQIVVMQKDASALKTFIDSMWGGGNTSIDIGMKWGTALLDSSLQPVISNMISDGAVASAFEGRPNAYSSSETLKVIVLMTDGQNTSQYYIHPDFRSGESNIWWNEQEEKYSVYIGEDSGDEDNDGDLFEPMFYWPHDGTWNDHAYGEGTYETTEISSECTSFRKNGKCKKYKEIETTVTVDEPGSAEVITYEGLWAYTSMKYNRDNHYKPWMGYDDANYDWYSSIRKYVGSSAKNTRTQAICDAAKDEDIVVFTIGFEAPSGGQTVLQNCASSASHYFDVDGLEINDAFAAIAASIRQLRLTQ